VQLLHGITKSKKKAARTKLLYLPNILTKEGEEGEHVEEGERHVLEPLVLL
jgi:hypothetical protein